MVLSAVCLLTGFSGNQSGVSSAPQELPRFPYRRQRTPAQLSAARNSWQTEKLGQKMDFKCPLRGQKTLFRQALTPVRFVPEFFRQ